MGLVFLFTIIAQNSSVTTSLLVPFAAVGLVTLESVFPYIMGANVGTTATALLAALATGSTVAITVALSHVLLNTIGAIILYPLRAVPIGLNKKLGEYIAQYRGHAFTYVGTLFFVIPLIAIISLQ